MNGFLIVDKPAGPTSHDVIARCRRALGVRRIGHAGTLDPPATGVLLVGVGRATRLLRFLEVHDKEYVATINFGSTTTTEDATGEVIETRDATALTETDVVAALPAFRGEIEQVPPMVSAIKVDGERLYRKARRGEEVERAPRPVTIHELELMEARLPAVSVRVACSKGTYIRSLAADIGQAVGTGAHLGALRRTRIGPFRVEDAIGLDDVGPEMLRPMEQMMDGYPRRDVDDSLVRDLTHGKRIPAAGLEGPYGVHGPAGLVAVCEDVEGGARSLCVLI